MGIDMTPNPDNPNANGGGSCLLGKERPRDRIIYDSKDGNVFWQYDAVEGYFVTLNLPWFFQNAPERVRIDMVEWIRQVVVRDHAELPRPPMPQSVKDYRDDPRTKAMRAQMKRGYVSLEDYQ